MDIFVGVPQSKYAGAALLMSLIAVSIAVLVGRDEFPLSQKFAFVLLIFLVSLPGLLMTLFQLTCLVTGSKNGKAWWCGVYSWIVSILLIIYSILLVTVAVMSLATGGKVLEDIARNDIDMFKAATEQANNDASALFAGPPPETAVQQFVAPAPVSAPEQALPPLPAIPGDLMGISAFDDKADMFSDYAETFADAPPTDDLRTTSTEDSHTDDKPAQPARRPQPPAPK